MKRCLYSK